MRFARGSISGYRCIYWGAMTTVNQSQTECWEPSDLLFLKLALERGMTFAEVAGFLSRDEDEVREKAKQMKRRRSRHRGVRRGA
jgi:hypothetical protein